MQGSGEHRFSNFLPWPVSASSAPGRGSEGSRGSDVLAMMRSMEKARVLEVAGDAPALGQAGGTMVSREAELAMAHRAELCRTGPGCGLSPLSLHSRKGREGNRNLISTLSGPGHPFAFK